MSSDCHSGRLGALSHPYNRSQNRADDRSLRREKFLPELDSTDGAKGDPKGDPTDEESKHIYPRSSLSTDGYNLRRRLASQPISHISEIGAVVMGKHTWIRPRQMPESC